MGKTKIVGAATVAVVVLAGAGAVAYATTRPAAPSYRLASASTGSVVQTSDAIGTLVPATQASLSFPVSGTVAKVAVSLGQKVKAGQTIAAIDPTSLEQSVAEAEATLASAKEKLSTDLAIQNGTATASEKSGGVSSSSARRGAGSDGGFVTALARSSTTAAADASTVAKGSSATAISSAQQAVIAATTQLSTDNAQLKADLAIVASECTASSSDASASQDPASPSDTASGAAPASSSGSTACAGAIAQLGADQQAVDTDMVNLTTAQNALNQAITDAAGESPATPAPMPSAGSTGTDGAGAPSKAAPRSGTSESSRVQGKLPEKGAGAGSAKTPGSGGTGAGSGGSDKSSSGRTNLGESGTGTSSSESGGSASTTVTAAQISADQSSIDAANANLAAAKQSLAAATLTAPISGTVQSLSVATGDSVSASTNVVTIVQPEAYTVELALSSNDIWRIKVGQPVTAVADGVASPLTGTVSSIGILATSGSTASTYPVVVALDHSSARLFSGAQASVSIQIAKATNVLTVPTSAIHTTGQRAYVRVDADGTLANKTVQLGAVGQSRTQIVSGLSAGDQVVLADLGQAIPSGSSEVSSRISRMVGGSGGLSNSSLTRG